MVHLLTLCFAWASAGLKQHKGFYGNALFVDQASAKLWPFIGGGLRIITLGNGGTRIYGYAGGMPLL